MITSVSSTVLISMLAIVGIVAYFSLVTIWSRRDTYLRWFTVILFLMSIPATVGLTTEFLGWHKPYDLAWRLSGQQLWIMAHVLLPDQGIYIYVETQDEPRAIVLPWDDDLAEKITKAAKNSEQNGERGFMLFFEPSLDDNPDQHHPMPQPIFPIPKGPSPDMPTYDRSA